MKKIGIIGIGNPLRRDDGIGLILLEKLKNIKDKLPVNMEYIDGGTGGIKLLHILSDFDLVILLDAVNFNGEIGESRLLKFEDIKRKKDLEFKSTHSMDILKVIEISKNLDNAPKNIFIFAIQPADISFGMNISKKLNDNLELIMENLVNKLVTIKDC